MNGQIRSRTVAVLCAAAIVLAGCQNMSQQGCLVGGAIGAGAATAAGGNDGRNALVGFLVGCVLGSNYAQWVQQEKRKYANAQAFYDAQLEATRYYNGQIERYNEAMAAEIVRLDQESAELETQYRAGQKKRRDLDNQRKVLSARKAEVDKGVSEAEDRRKQRQAVLDDMRKYGGDPGVAVLAGEIDRLEKAILSLRGQSTALGNLNNRLRF
jgi:hypothetical protein